MIDWRRLILLYLTFLVGGAAIAAMLWLVFGDGPTFTVTAAITVPVLILFVVAYVARGGGALPGADHAHDVFGVMNRDRRDALSGEYSGSPPRWISRRLVPVTAAGAALTLLGFAALLYFAFGVR